MIYYSIWTRLLLNFPCFKEAFFSLRFTDFLSSFIFLLKSMDSYNAPLLFLSFNHSLCSKMFRRNPDPLEMKMQKPHAWGHKFSLFLYESLNKCFARTALYSIPEKKPDSRVYCFKWIDISFFTATESQLLERGG